MEKAIQLIKGGFSFRVKRELSSSLDVWQEGFTEHRVKGPGDFEHHAISIRENPVRARLAENAEGYEYGSARGGVQIDPPPPWLKPRNKDREPEFAGLKPGASTAG